MKNLESRQAAVTLLQIKNYDPNKYAVKPEDEPRLLFNSVPSLPPADRASDVMHCNAVIDIISKAVAVAQRENEESEAYPPNYTSVIDRSHVGAAGDSAYQRDYPEEQYSVYNTSQNAPSPCSNDDHENKEMDLSLYGFVKNEPSDQSDRDSTHIYFQRTLNQNKTNFVDEYKQHIFEQTANKMKISKDNSSVYEECSQSSSGSDPDRLQMDISQMSQVSNELVNSRMELRFSN